MNGGTVIPRRVVVTGAAGFVGVPTTKALLEQGVETYALDNFTGAPRERLEHIQDTGDLTIVEVDLRDANATRNAIEAIDPWAVVHLAAIHFIPYCVARPAEALAVNVGGTQNLLDALVGTSTERFVFASTADVYQPSMNPHRIGDPTAPINVYGASKLTGEWLVRFNAERMPELSSAVIRLFNVYGPGETNPHVMPEMFDQLRRGDVLNLGNTQPERDYVFVEDVAAVLAATALDPSAQLTFNLGTGTSTSVGGLVNHLRRIIGRDIEVRVDPARVRRSDRPRLKADVTELRALYPGLSPRSLEDGLAQTLGHLGLVEQV